MVTFEALLEEDLKTMIGRVAGGGCRGRNYPSPVAVVSAPGSVIASLYSSISSFRCHPFLPPSRRRVQIQGARGAQGRRRRRSTRNGGEGHTSLAHAPEGGGGRRAWTRPGWRPAVASQCGVGGGKCGRWRCDTRVQGQGPGYRRLGRR
jgi:hypothetical protein